MDKTFIYERLSETLENLSFKSCRHVLMYAKELEAQETCKMEEDTEGGIFQQLEEEKKANADNVNI